MMQMKLSKLLLSMFFFISTAASAIEIKGGGGPLATVLINEWGNLYTKRLQSTTPVVTYTTTTPADGIKRLMNKEVDFSVIDMPLSYEELQKKGLIQFPIALGFITPVFNIPGIHTGQLLLDAQTLGDIFLGRITKWNDPALKALNPKIILPNENIIVVHRTSPPGLKTVIGNMLTKAHSDWKTIKNDGDMSGTWPPLSIEVKDSSEMAPTVKKTSYSIGYSPIPMAIKAGISHVKLKNKAGKFVIPSDVGVIAAASNADWAIDNGYSVSITYTDGAESWPMSYSTFILMHKVSDQPERSREVLNFMKYGLTYGALTAVAFDYVPFPRAVAKKMYPSYSLIVDSKGVPVFK